MWAATGACWQQSTPAQCVLWLLLTARFNSRRSITADSVARRLCDGREHSTGRGGVGVRASVRAYVRVIGQTERINANNFSSPTARSWRYRRQINFLSEVGDVLKLKLFCRNPRGVSVEHYKSATFCSKDNSVKCFSSVTLLKTVIGTLLYKQRSVCVL